MLYISFTPAPLSSAWIFTYFLNYLLASLSILLIMIVKSLKSYLYCFFWNCIVFRYSYQSCISYYFPVSLNVITYSMLSLVTCLISPSWYVITWHLFISLDSWCDITWHPACYYLTLAPYYDITNHLPRIILTLDLWLSYLRESYRVILYYIHQPVILYFIQWPVLLLYMYSCTLEFLIMSCTCYSRKLIITY